MVEIIIHFDAVLCSRENDGLLGPLVSLAFRPATCANSFLPTMPDDPLQEVRSAAITGQLYECPNGHPYLVTEDDEYTKTALINAESVLTSLKAKIPQDPFEHLADKFKEPLGDALKLTVSDILRKLSDASLDIFVSLLLEMITLQLNDEHSKEYRWWLKIIDNTDDGCGGDDDDIMTLVMVTGWWLMIIDNTDDGGGDDDDIMTLVMVTGW
ncbi:hypothetical protein QZH41_000837 [Actinostola sp. cb2023]|nr:hypothetical protein QZH41_000837 [Actinostola sp. cb2023]